MTDKPLPLHKQIHGTTLKNDLPKEILFKIITGEKIALGINAPVRVLGINGGVITAQRSRYAPFVCFSLDHFAKFLIEHGAI